MYWIKQQHFRSSPGTANGIAAELVAMNFVRWASVVRDRDSQLRRKAKFQSKDRVLARGRSISGVRRPHRHRELGFVASHVGLCLEISQIERIQNLLRSLDLAKEMGLLYPATSA